MKRRPLPRGATPAQLALFAGIAASIAVTPPAWSQAPPAPPAATSSPAAPTPASPAAPPTPQPVVQKVREAPPPPNPTPAQLKALAELQEEAKAYEKAAKEYRASITRIVQHHYEDKRRRILSGLDAEIVIEKKALRDAREEAIKRLEAFVLKYSGANAHPENTPDAMFRLAALYEERAKTDTDTIEDLAAGLLPAIALYKRIIVEFPSYRELAAIHYYLGHALNDSSRLPEAQQVWRTLVCRNHFPYPVAVDPADSSKDSIVPLPQDHDAAFWSAWESRHPIPPGAPGAKAPAKARAKPGPAGAAAAPAGDEMTFVNPYPDDCQAIPQKTAAGEDPRYIAESWWLIGDYHFNEVDPAGGPYNLNRAEAAYLHSLRYKKPPVYGVAMYKLAWTYYKQQRYETSVRQFIELLRYTDEQQKITGDPGTDFRTEAYTYIAGSLTYVDFTGPQQGEPYIPRSDALDDASQDPKIAEAKMRIAFDRVQDEKLIPQKEKWTVEIYKALAQEFKELSQHRNVIEISEMILAKFPMDRDAPIVQNQIADTYDLLLAGAQEGTAARAEYSKKALEARTKLSNYVGTTPWVQANKDDPEALQTAERLVKNGLRRAAADHSNAGKALYDQAKAIGDPAEAKPVFERALSEYRLAATGWAGVLAQDENTPEAYESRFWQAEAYYMVVTINVAMEQTPSADEVAIAKKTASDVRDSNEDNKYLQQAAFMVVDTAFQVLLDQYGLFKRTKGSQGIEERTELKTTGEAEKRKAVTENVPKPILDVIAAQDEYIRRVPAPVDTPKNAPVYGFQSADFYFLYGQFAEAKKRFRPIYEEQCGKSEYGYRAWERLTTMANLENNVDESRKLAEAALKKSCAVSEDQKVKEEGLARPTISRGYYVDAARAYEKAEKMADGPERKKAWREAGALYKVALEKAPSRDEAPEAAINGAIAYKQVGDYDQAIAMYTLFIKEYGSEQNLKTLEKGDPNAKPPKNPDPTKYAERVKYLKRAYDDLSAAYVNFFNFRAAAETFDTVSKNPRFETDDRRKAARNAVLLWADQGERDKLLASRATFFSMNPPADQKADIDFLVAEADLKAWDEKAPDEGANRTARTRAVTAMDAYYTQNKANAAAAPYNVQAAYYSAKLRKAGKDPKAADWCKTTTQAFQTYKASAPNKDGKNTALGSIQSDMAAECAYTALDAKLKAEFDYDTGHQHYDGVIDKVLKQFTDSMKKAESVYGKELQSVVETYESPNWSVAAIARQGSLFDSCRTGLFNARPPALKLYTPKEEKLLKLAETSAREDLEEQADAIRQSRREQWRAARERSLNEADREMINRYATAVTLAKFFKVRNPSLENAIRRLAFFSNLLGDAKMREHVKYKTIKDPSTKGTLEYKDGMFLKSRPGLTPNQTNDGMPTPAPVIIQ